MATHSSILAWRISWTEEPGWLQSQGHKESNRTERLILSLSHTTLEMCTQMYQHQVGTKEEKYLISSVNATCKLIVLDILTAKTEYQ